MSFADMPRGPSAFVRNLLALPPGQARVQVVIDEIQKVPALLDEVHWLHENQGSDSRCAGRALASFVAAESTCSAVGRCGTSSAA
jgi:hypothetical protein